MTTIHNMEDRKSDFTFSCATIPAGTVLLLPVRVVYEIEQTDGAFVCVEAIEGGRRMLVRLADLKTTDEAK